MNRGILGPVRTWLGTALALGLALGCLWGSLRGIYLAIEKGYLQLPAPTVALYAIKSQVNTTVASTVGLLLGGLVLLVACYVALRFLRVSSRSADVGAAIWAILVIACPVIGYYLNKADWFPDFWSVTGMLCNALVVSVFLGVGLACWTQLRRIRDRLDPLLEGTRRVFSVRLALAFAVYWLLVNLGFHALNVRAGSRASAAEAFRPRVVVIALDGAMWNVMDPLLREGRLPNIERLKAAGAYAALETFEPTLSPIIWTTVATGKPMSAHGITGFTVQDGGADAGKLMTSNMRRVKALWNILSERGRSVGVVGWFVTWPAEPVNGFLVSSYTGLGGLKKGRLDKDVPELTYPRELIGALEPAIRRAEAELEQRYRQVFPRIDMSRLSETQRDVVKDTREVLLADLLNVSAGLDLLRTHAPEFFAIYLGGIDVISHRFWKYMYPDAAPYRVEAEHIAMFGDAINNYVMLTDELVGRIVAACDENTLFVVMSDHGMGAYIPEDRNDDRVSGHHHDAPPGILILSGQHVERGPLRASANVFDIAPTVLHALHLPLAEDMAGLPILTAFNSGFRRFQTPEYVRTYETADARRGPRSARESHVDEDLKERLKSLGYL
jgi:predicted AlkP superfamily phosphohydrolase/phosphomutase